MSDPDPASAALYQAARTLADGDPTDGAKAIVAARLAEQAGLHHDTVAYYAQALRADPADAEVRAALVRLCDVRELESLKLPSPPPSRSFTEDWARGWAYPARPGIFLNIYLGGALTLTGLGLVTTLFPFILPVMLVGIAGYGLLFCGEVVRAGRSDDPERLHWPGAEGDLMDATFWTGMLAVLVARGGAILAWILAAVAATSFNRAIVRFATSFNAPGATAPPASWTDPLPTVAETAPFAALLLPLIPVPLIALLAADDSLLQALNPLRQFRRLRHILLPYSLVALSFLVSLGLAAAAGYAVWKSWRSSGPGTALLVTPVCTTLWMWLYLTSLHHIGLLARHYPRQVALE